MLLGRDRNQLFKLFEIFGNVVAVFKVGLEVVPLVGIGGFYEFLSLVSQLEVNLDFFSQQSAKSSGLRLGNFNFIKLDGKLFIWSCGPFFFKLSRNFCPKGLVELLSVSI